MLDDETIHDLESQFQELLEQEAEATKDAWVIREKRMKEKEQEEAERKERMRKEMEGKQGKRTGPGVNYPLVFLLKFVIFIISDVCFQLCC